MIGILKEACRKNNIRDISFARISYIQNNSENLKELTTFSLALVDELCDNKIDQFTVNQNGNSIGIIGKLKTKGMFNICCTSLLKIDQPFLRIELVGNESMLVFDTSQEDAFLGNFKMRTEKDLEVSKEVSNIINKIDWDLK